MIKLYENGNFLVDGKIATDSRRLPDKDICKKGTIAYNILKEHNTSGDMEDLKIKFDAMASHDITYVGIIQTARASGFKQFPIPYVLTNCHNSLCAVGGTINEDDHKFALSAAKKYGGIYVPPNLAVIHQYMRECMAGCGKMILGSDSHTRYGALGTMAVGEGGGELAKQLLGRTYDVKLPEVVGVYLTGAPRVGVGPQDVALTIIGKVFKNGFVKNKIMEFVGDGIANLNVEYRNGIDVMTTETACLTSVWQTDEKVHEYLTEHGRESDYCELKPKNITFYDKMIELDLSEVEPMIALPFHPSNTYTIREFKANTYEILKKQDELNNSEFKLVDKLVNGEFIIEQGIVAGCAGGTFDNIVEIANMIGEKSMGNDVFSMSVYPSSQPTYLELVKNGAVEKLMDAGVVVRSAFCGPCFGAGDVPANGEISVRHTTRNFPNREGSKPSDNQQSAVCLMDARSVMATALNGGKLTSAFEFENYPDLSKKPEYHFNKGVYEKRVYNGFGSNDLSSKLVMGPNIKDWPLFSEMPNNLLLCVASYITDDVTTTDELIPSGEASSYRSNPYKLSEMTLSRKDPEYLGRTKKIFEYEKKRKEGDFSDDIIKRLECQDLKIDDFMIGSVIYANKPGDGSAREQAASCQRVLGGLANIAKEYATKRYRSNLINWGILPFIIENEFDFGINDFILIRNIKDYVKNGKGSIIGTVIRDNGGTVGTRRGEIILSLGDLTEDEREILIKGCLINYYNQEHL